MWDGIPVTEISISPHGHPVGVQFHIDQKGAGPVARLDRYRQRSAGGIRAIGERTEQPLEELLWSYVHMLCNRIFKSEPRKCEAVLYDFVYQALKTKHILAGKRKQASSLAT